MAVFSFIEHLLFVTADYPNFSLQLNPIFFLNGILDVFDYRLVVSGSPVVNVDNKTSVFR
jgi:hypothetical protein